MANVVLESVMATDAAGAVIRPAATVFSLNDRPPGGFQCPDSTMAKIGFPTYARSVWLVTALSQSLSISR
jgi:hypothetical protein